eukprot:6635329-Prymnesium_polylepis.1
MELLLVTNTLLPSTQRTAPASPTAEEFMILLSSVMVKIEVFDVTNTAPAIPCGAGESGGMGGGSGGLGGAMGAAQPGITTPVPVHEALHRSEMRLPSNPAGGTKTIGQPAPTARSEKVVVVHWQIVSIVPAKSAISANALGISEQADEDSGTAIAGCDVVIVVGAVALAEVFIEVFDAFALAASRRKCTFVIPSEVKPASSPPMILLNVER